MVCRKNSPLAREAARLRLEVRTLPFLMEWDPLTALRLQSLAAARPNPVLHAHTAHAASLAALAGGLRRLPHVAHRRVDFALSGFLSRRLKYQRAGMVVCVSEAIRAILLKAGLPREKTVVVPDGLPVGAEECSWVGAEAARFAPAGDPERARLRSELAQELEIDARAPWIGNLAALVPHKDHDTLLAAALLVCREAPRAVFLVAGEGPEEDRLRRQILRLDLGRSVFLIGHREAAPLLKSLDVFVLSSWGEGMGSVLLEAAACGAPIAATSAGGIPEIVEDGRTGLLCPPRQPEALARSILRLLDDDGLRRSVASRAREGLERFRLTRMAESMEEVYERIA